MEFSEHDTQYASQIVERLLSDDGEKLDLKLEKDIVISDLELDANSFSNDLDISKDFGWNIPVVRIARNDGYIPVSLQSILGQTLPFGPYGRSRRWWRKDPFYHQFFYEALRSLFSKEKEIAGFHTISRDEARNAFTIRAINFLATRITAVRSFRDVETRESEKWGKLATLNLLQTTRGAQVTTPGCYFSVSTNSSGLRVFWSGAYYLSPNYFSHPTSPVTSVLQAGTYIFGVDGGAYGNIIQWDTNAVVSLPGNPSVHLNY